MSRYSMFSVLIGLFAVISSSSSYYLQNYSLGGGATNSATSSQYQAQANVGEISGPTASGTNYQAKTGAIQAEQANVPPAPILSTNSNSYYNKLGLIISTGNNPSDATYVVAVSTNNFNTTYYVESDGTLGSTPYFQTYSGWGGASGSYIVGLLPATTYEVKVSAISGKFTQSAYGPYATATTSTPQLTFSLSPSNQNIGSLTAGTVVKSPSQVNFNISTNALYGADIYVADKYNGLYSSANNSYIPSYTGNLVTPAHGFGLQNVTESPSLNSFSPYNATGTNVGGVSKSFSLLFGSTQPISNDSATSQIFAKSAITDPSGADYSDVITFIAAASY